jgi:hypothetical protein
VADVVLCSAWAWNVEMPTIDKMMETLSRKMRVVQCSILLLDDISGFECVLTRLLKKVADVVLCTAWTKNMKMPIVISDKQMEILSKDLDIVERSISQLNDLTDFEYLLVFLVGMLATIAFGLEARKAILKYRKEVAFC